MEKDLSKLKERSYFCVWNNVDQIFDKTNTTIFDGISEKSRQMVIKFRENLTQDSYTASEMVDYVINIFMDGKEERRSCGANYEIGDDGKHHIHAVFEDKSQVRFSTLQKLFPTIHIEKTRGESHEVIDYLYKKGKYAEKSYTTVVSPKIKGEIVGKQGNRSDLQKIQELIEEGLSPEEIMSENISYRRFSKMIKEHYFQRKLKLAPLNKENMKVLWHTGEPNSGKSFTQNLLKEEFGRDNVYVWSDFQNGGLDNYVGESILFLDEYKGELSFAEFLKVTDVYVQQVHSRYSNVYALWDEVHISSIFSPKKAYELMVSEELRRDDTMGQMTRRISEVVYHFSVEEGGEILFKTVAFSVDDFSNKSKKELENICSLFHIWRPDVTDYDFARDAFALSMKPKKQKGKKNG